MRKLTISSTRSAAILRLKSWPLTITAALMLSVLPIKLGALKFSSAEAAVPQCAAQPQISNRCAQSSCMKAGPCYFGIVYQPRACLKWRCTKARRT
jgi:hypothetical protein